MKKRKSKLTIITKESQVDELIQHCLTTGYCSLDFETSALEFYNTDEFLLTLGISFQPHSAWVIPLGHKDSPFKHNWIRIFRKFGKAILENHDVVKVAWNFKYEYKWCMRYDIWCKGILLDAQLAKYLLDEERPHDLKKFVQMMFEEWTGYGDEMKGDDEVSWRDKPFKKLCRYNGLDSDLTLRGMIIMEPKLIKQGFYSMFRNMMMMVTRVLAEAEYYGFRVDRPYLKNLMVVYEEKIRVATKDMRNDRALLKFEKRYKQEHLRNLVNKVQLEIANLTREDAQANAVKIRNRENKIKGFYEGIFNNKEKWEPMNFASPPQVRRFFFESKFGLRLKPHKFTKNKDTKQRSETPSTDEESLLALAPKDKTGFMKKLLDLRGLEKLNGTYITGMYQHLDRYDYVHAGFRLNGTVTGRLSCVKPNLQNIPRGTTAGDIKKMFKPPKGFLQWELDYSQAELRLIAEVSKDKAMIDIFKRNYNVHVATGAKMVGKLHMYDKIKAWIKLGEALGGKELEKPEHKRLLYWVKQKKKGKSFNFSIIYQQGDEAIAETLKCSIAEARKFKREWFKAYPQATKWIRRQKERAHKYEYVRNIFGTKRRLHDVNSGVKWQEAEAERQAVNAPIQGGSGYFTLFSMVVIREKQMMGLLPRDFSMRYTVHDSLGGYIRPRDIHTVFPFIEKICNNPETLKYFGFELKHVVMKVSPEAGKTWEGLKDYSPTEDYTKWIA